MFGFLKKKQPPPVDFRAKALVFAVRLYYKDVLDIVEYVEGPFPRLHEAGIYVGAATQFALKRLGALGVPDTEEISTLFAQQWLIYLEVNPNEKPSPTREVLSARFNSKAPVYQMLQEEIITAIAQDDDVSKPSMQLMWELFTNCTDIESPNNFLRLTNSSGVLIEVTSELMSTVRKTFE